MKKMYKEGTIWALEMKSARAKLNCLHFSQRSIWAKPKFKVLPVKIWSAEEVAQENKRRSLG